MGIIRKNHPHFVICSLHFSYLNTVSDICRIIYREMLLMQKNTSSAEKYVFFCQTLLFLSDAFTSCHPYQVQLLEQQELAQVYQPTRTL